LGAGPLVARRLTTELQRSIEPLLWYNVRVGKTLQPSPWRPLLRQFISVALALGACALVTILSQTSAAAQTMTDGVPTLAATRAPSPAVVEAAAHAPESAKVRLKPLAIDDAVVGLAIPVGGYAAVIPPAPRLVHRFATRSIATTSLAINSSYGYRRDPITGGGRMHTGVDLKASYGDSVGAAASGTVVWASYRGGYGNLVVVDHGNGIATYYAHLSSVTVAAGERVLAGQKVGLAGSTGRSTGPHLHYEVRVQNVPVDPTSTLTIKKGVVLANGRPVAGRPLDGGDDEGAAATTKKKAEPAPPPPLPLFQSGDTLTNF
jgi:murein DD-endopeptidase MepM/ murein hydrolase activator NlpD